MNFSSDEVNLLIYRYLQESGFNNAAYTFATESNILRSNIDCSQVPNGALIHMLQKGYQYVGVEIEFDNKDNVKQLIDELTLIEAASPDILESIKEKKESQKLKTRRVCNKTDEDVTDDFNRSTTLMDGDPTEIFPSSIMKLGKPDRVICAWNPVANFLAGGSKDGTARIWDIDKVSNLNETTFKRAVKLPNGKAPNNIDITCLDWSFDGNYLAEGTYDGVTRVWTTDGRLTCNFDQEGPIFAMKWNQKGNYILTGGVDGSTNIWSSAISNHCIQKFHFHSDSVIDIAWGTNTSFASCSADKFIYLCQLYKGQPVKKFQGHTADINGIEWDPQRKLLASCSDDTTLKIWSTRKNTCVHNFQGHSQEVYTVRWSPTGPGSSNPNKNLILASGSLDTTMRLWDVESSSCVRTLTQHNKAICLIEFSPDGKFLVSGSYDKFVYIWSLESGELIHSYKASGGVSDAAWNSTGDQVAVSSFDGFVYVLNLRK